MSRDIDNAFKAIIASGWANQTDGDVESPMGFFTIIDMSTEREQITDILSDADLDGAMEHIEPSWYITTEDSQGFLSYERSTEIAAKEWFKQMQKRYFKWSDE
jgi:hypothetical protein